MGKPSKDGSDSQRKRKRVAVESSSDDDENEQDLEEVRRNLSNSRRTVFGTIFADSKTLCKSDRN